MSVDSQNCNILRENSVCVRKNVTRNEPKYQRFLLSGKFLSLIFVYILGTDVQTARGRLTGALKVAVAPPSEDDEAVDSSLPGNLFVNVLAVLFEASSLTQQI